MKSASSFAFNRHTKVGTLAGVSSDIDQMQVMRDDFLAALEEVHAAFGVNDTELKMCVKNDVFPFAPHIEVRACFATHQPCRASWPMETCL